MAEDVDDARLIVGNLLAAVETAVRHEVERQLTLLRTEVAVASPVSSSNGTLPTFLDIEELAELLRLGTKGADGKRPGGVRTIRQWIAEERIPHRRAGDRVLFLTSEVLEWTAKEVRRPRTRSR